ncbi:hypothetical protein D9M71_491180 [compost metagenome]
MALVVFESFAVALQCIERVLPQACLYRQLCLELRTKGALLEERGTGEREGGDNQAKNNCTAR